jgi:hemerythrin-like metal-binding protein
LAYIEWTKDLETGIAPVDRDHKVLVSMLNQVEEAIGDHEERAVLGSVLNSLAEYTTYHFAREERLQEVAGYAGLAEHRALHGRLEGQVEAIRDRYHRDPTSVQAQEVLDFLTSWLVDHILKQDMGYREACVGNAKAIEAAETMRFGEESAPVSEGPQPKPLNWSALRVLVVEDNRNFQLIIQTILKSLGVRDIRLASSGAEGLERLDAALDLILCDWRMEGMDGLEFVREARTAGTAGKIIMMSGYGNEGVREQALSAGVNDFLEKPITARGFMETAARLLNTSN